MALPIVFPSNSHVTWPHAADGSMTNVNVYPFGFADLLIAGDSCDISAFVVGDQTTCVVCLITVGVGVGVAAVATVGVGVATTGVGVAPAGVGVATLTGVGVAVRVADGVADADAEAEVVAFAVVDAACDAFPAAWLLLVDDVQPATDNKTTITSTMSAINFCVIFHPAL